MTDEGVEVGLTVTILFDDFADYLLKAGLDLQSILGNFRNAGLIGDGMVEVTASDNPADKLDHYAARLNLTIGRHRVVRIRSAILDAKRETAPAAPQYVSRDQLALICGLRSKKTIERWLEDGKLPPPDIEGGGGKPDQWIWATVREALATETRKILPERFPSMHQPS